MLESMANALATLIRGETMVASLEPFELCVTVTRADGRYVMIEDGAAAVYLDSHACWKGYQTCGSDPKGAVDAREWDEWGFGRRWASDLAEMIGGEARQTGGNVWVVVVGRPDGTVAVIGTDGGSVFASRAAYDSGEEEISWIEFYPE
jgi:hypothetical protein